VGSAHGGVRVVGGRGGQIIGFTHVSPRGANANLEAPGQAGVGVAVAQMSQGERALATGIEASPTGSVLATVTADVTGEVVQDPDGQRGRVRQHGEAPGWGIGSWSTAVLSGSSSYVDTGHGTPVTCTITMK
jgi:hypothetical protein